MKLKNLANKQEMPQLHHINCKALQELLLYYLRERISSKNLEVKYIAATSIYEWFIFEATLFEKYFAQNKQLVKQFMDFEEGRLGGTTTELFYKEIAEPAIAAVEENLAFTHIDIRHFERQVGAGLTNYYILKDGFIKQLSEDAPAPNVAIMHPRVLGSLAKLKDTSNQPLQRPETLTNLRILPTSKIPNNQEQRTGENLSTIFMGDFSNLVFWIRLDIKIKPLRELYSENYQVGFLAVTRMDVNVYHPQAFTLITVVA